MMIVECGMYSFAGMSANINFKSTVCHVCTLKLMQSDCMKHKTCST